MSASVRPLLAAFPAPRAVLAPAYRPAAPAIVRAPHAGALDAPLGRDRRAIKKGGGAQIAAALIAAALCGWTVYADPVAHARAARFLAPFADALLPPAPAFAVADLQARRGELDGQPILYIEGVERNLTGQALRSATVRVSLLGEDGSPLYSWTTRPSAAEVGANAAAPFRARLLSPPAFHAIAVSVVNARR